MQWWCSASTEPWSWGWEPYVGVWLAVAAAVFAYRRAWVRARAAGALGADDRRRPLWFALAVGMLWVATDWPVGALGAGYLASVHMLQFMLYTLIAAPLLLIGIPAAFVDGFRERRWWPAMGVLTRPVVAGVAFNIVLLSTHAPVIVDLARASQLGSFAMDLLWLVAGVVLWMPLCSPAGELRHPSLAVRGVYLFMASGVFPMLPGAFLVFAEVPLYQTFELAPPVGGLDAAVDQQIAGLLMKVGNVPILWPVLGVLFFRWATEDRAAPPLPGVPASAEVAAGPAVVAGDVR